MCVFIYLVSEKVKEMISRSVVKSTRTNYTAAVTVWKAFRHEHDNWQEGEELYHADRDKMQTVLLVLEFIKWLEGRYTPGVINRLITGLGFHLNCAVIHAGILAHPSIVGARKSVTATVNRKETELTLGLNLDMLQSLRNTLWVSSTTLDQRMTYIAIITGYTFTMRPGHIAYMGPNATDHRYRLGDLTIELASTGALLSFTEWLSLRSDTTQDASIGLLILRTNSSKTHGIAKGGDGSLNFICEGNDIETQYFHDFQEWLLSCNLELTPMIPEGTVSDASLDVLERPLFSRIHPITKSFKKLLIREVSSALKLCAEGVGLHRSSFSGKSLRIGGTTVAVASGATSGEILRATGHAGIETARIYTRSTRHTSTSLGYAGTVEVQDLKRMALKRHRK